MTSFPKAVGCGAFHLFRTRISSAPGPARYSRCSYTDSNPTYEFDAAQSQATVGLNFSASNDSQFSLEFGKYALFCNNAKHMIPRLGLRAFHVITCQKLANPSLVEIPVTREVLSSISFASSYTHRVGCVRCSWHDDTMLISTPQKNFFCIRCEQLGISHIQSDVNSCRRHLPVFVQEKSCLIDF